LNYRPIEALGFELGGRYSQDSESYTFNRHFVVPFAIFPAGTPVVTSKRYNTSSSRGDYRFAINYRFTPNVMAYASTSTGYKAGGINPRTTSDATVTTFSPETLTAYEAGLKTEWLDHRLRVNADVFFSNYQNLQLNTTQAVPGGFQVVYENVSHAHIYGVETEVTAQPTRALSFYANAGWLHFKYLDLGGAGFDPVYNTGGITPGAPPPLTPTWKGAIGGSYRMALGNERGSVTLRADESYQSRIYFDNQGTPAASQGGYAVLNTALNWQSQNEAWLVSLRVNNALDKLYWVSESNLINPLGILSAQPSMPRTYMVTARHTF
jgi:iron complex outermembrane receptor protein